MILELATWVMRGVGLLVVCVVIPFTVTVFIGDLWDMLRGPRCCALCGHVHGPAHEAAHHKDSQVGPDLERIP